MRVALFSDVHAIHHALFAFDREVKRNRVDAYWCLGDVVGYGPYPDLVIERIRQILARSPQNVVIRGNHDDGVGFWEQPEGEARRALFDPATLKIVEQHAQFLSAEERVWLRKLPIWVEMGGCYLTHGAFGSTEDEALWTYATRDLALARASLERVWEIARSLEQPARIVAVGHYHVPALLRWNDHTQRLEPLDPWENGGRHEFHDLSQRPVMLNPGSISLPRDVGERSTSAYLILTLEGDSVVLEFRQLAYNYCPLLADIKAGNPLSDRLRREIRLSRLPEGVTCEESG